jgi:uncharacterized protein (TIGR03437 family)
LRFEVSSDEAGAMENVTIEARSHSGSASESLLVLSAETVHLRAPSNLTTTPDSAVRFTVTAVDDQGLPVSVNIENRPDTATFDATSGLFEWIPKDLGSAAVSFTATNSLGSTQTKTVDIHVVTSRPFLAGLRNAAGAGAVAACTPGTLATLTGTSLGNSDSAGTVRVLVNGISAPATRSSNQQVDFLCPRLPSGTSLTISVEAGGVASNELRTVMETTAPGLFSLDSSGSGIGVVLHARGLAALPRFDRTGMPAITGDAIALFATGMNCDGSTGGLKPLLYVGHVYQQVTLQPSSFAGVCEVHAVVPSGLAGNEVSLVLEGVREDGAPVRSNQVLIAIEN